jgi:hypothetical protein
MRAAIADAFERLEAARAAMAGPRSRRTAAVRAAIAAARKAGERQAS